MTNSSLPAGAGFLRLKQVLELYPVSARTWWAGVKTGRFPRPVKLGPRATGWAASDIQALLDKVRSRETA